MNLPALLQNWAKPFCGSIVSRLKYLYWLYSKRWPLRSTEPLTIRFEFAPPVLQVDLMVRCNGGGDAFIFSEVFEHRYYDFDLPMPPATVLDLGANIGLTALFLARKYPGAQMACVEPMPGNLALLWTNLERNGVSAKIFGNAIAVEDKPVVMQIANDDYGHKISNIDYGRRVDGSTQRVDGISVPTVLQELGWDRIGLLKIDIEGYEGVLLRERCEWLERVDALCIECHEGYGEDDLLALARRFGFEAPEHLRGTTLMVRNPVPTSSTED